MKFPIRATLERTMIRSRHGNKQSVKQAKILTVEQMCVAMEAIPAPANRPENDHDAEVSCMT